MTFVSVIRRRCSLVFLLTLARASAAFGQIRSATLIEAVTDATKAVVPGATGIVSDFSFSRSPCSFLPSAFSLLP
jgi:hypothetical protein